MNKKMKFITTSDPEVKEKLLKEGLVLVEESSGSWTFLNSSSPTTFEVEEAKKICFTNKLCL